MSKLARATQSVFGGTIAATPTGNMSQFGSLKAGALAYTADPATIQALAAFANGWAAAVTSNSAPVLQDMNAIDFLITRQLAYLMQTGVPEWDSGTTYYIGSVVQGVATGVMYISLTDANLSNAVTDTTKWAPMTMSQYTKTVGSQAAGCMYTSLATALAACSAGDSLLIKSSLVFTSDVTISVADLNIKCMPGVTLTFNSGCTNGLIITGDRFSFEGSLIAGTSLTSLLYLNAHDAIVSKSRFSSTSGTLTESILIGTSKARNYIEASIYSNGGTITNKIVDNSGLSTNDYALRGDGV